MAFNKFIHRKSPRSQGKSFTCRNLFLLRALCNFGVDKGNVLKTVIIIPARFESSRFPGKPLALIDGLPMIGRVILRAKRIPDSPEVVVATDDLRIAEAALAFKAQIVMTRPITAPEPTAWPRPPASWGSAPDTLVINIQGDQPFFPD